MTHLARWKLLADWPAGGNTYLEAGEIIEAPVRISDGALAGPPTWGSPCQVRSPWNACRLIRKQRT
jgi:hypothetical protein